MELGFHLDPLLDCCASGFGYLCYGHQRTDQQRLSCKLRPLYLFTSYSLSVEKIVFCIVCISCRAWWAWIPWEAIFPPYPWREKFHPPSLSISPREAVLVTAHLPECLWVQLNFLLCNLKFHVQLCLAGDCWELPMGRSWPISWHICGKPSWARTVLVSRDLNSSLSLLLCDLQQIRFFNHLIRLNGRSEPIVFAFSSHTLCSFTSVLTELQSLTPFSIVQVPGKTWLYPDDQG